MGYNVVHGRQARSGFKLVSRESVKSVKDPSSANQTIELTSSGYRTDAQLACPFLQIIINIMFLLDRVEGWFTQPTLSPGDIQPMGIFYGRHGEGDMRWARCHPERGHWGQIGGKWMSRCESQERKKDESQPLLATLYPIGYRFQQPLFEPRLLPLASGLSFLWFPYHFTVLFPCSCTDLTVLHTEAFH